jgi:hypothetical protein
MLETPIPGLMIERVYGSVWVGGWLLTMSYGIPMHTCDETIIEESV